MYFMIFAGQRNREGDGLAWSGAVGVYEADSAEKACQAAAKKTGWLGSYFAVEGFPWGVELFETDAKEFGAERPDELSKMERLENRTRELERSVGIDGAA